MALRQISGGLAEKLDLYISFRESDTWGAPKKLDKINTPDEWELTPTLSPDGEYFFYELNGKIMQISTDELLRDI